MAVHTNRDLCLLCLIHTSSQSIQNSEDIYQRHSIHAVFEQVFPAILLRTDFKSVQQLGASRNGFAITLLSYNHQRIEVLPPNRTPHNQLAILSYKYVGMVHVHGSAYASGQTIITSVYKISMSKQIILTVISQTAYVTRELYLSQRDQPCLSIVSGPCQEDRIADISETSETSPLLLIHDGLLDSQGLTNGIPGFERHNQAKEEDSPDACFVLTRLTVRTLERVVVVLAHDMRKHPWSSI